MCTGTSYSFELNGGPLAPLTNPSGPGYGNLTEDQLQFLLNSTFPGQTVYLQQRAVVYLNHTLMIPEGVTLATFGLPSPNQHGRMARLVRASAFAAPMVQINDSGSLRNMWVDGQRTALTSGVLSAVNIAIYGYNITVDSNFIANSLGWTSLASFGSINGISCWNQTISNNLVTSYSARHYLGPLTASYTDGLSIGCDNSVVRNNSIIDPTDVGIVLFLPAQGSVQHSQVYYNTVISAGNSAFAAYGFDTGNTTPAHNQPPNFTGSSMSYNTLWSGPNTHFIIGLTVGSCAWYLSGTELIGYGATAIGNSTAGITTNFGEGITVSCMTSATVQGNAFNTNLIPSSWTYCPTGDVLASVSAGFASGYIQPFSDVRVIGCMSDLSPSDGY